MESDAVVWWRNDTLQGTSFFPSFSCLEIELSVLQIAGCVFLLFCFSYIVIGLLVLASLSSMAVRHAAYNPQANEKVNINVQCSHSVVTV